MHKPALVPVARLAVALLAGLTLTSIARADVAVPNQYAMTPGSTSGLNTFIRDNGNPRTGQLLINANELTGIVGSSINGITFRLWTGATAAYPATTATWADYTISLGPGVAFGSQTTTFASNFTATPTVVRTGPLTIPAASFPFGATPNDWAPYIPFTTPYVYSGGNLVVEVRHTGSNITNTASDFLEVALTTDPNYNVRFWSATATGAAATVGAQANFTVVRFQAAGTPVELMSFDVE